MANAGQAKFDPSTSERKSITPGFSNQNGKSDRTPITGSEKDSTSKPSFGAQGQAGADKSSTGSRAADAQAAEQGLAGAEKDAAAIGANNADDIAGLSEGEGLAAPSFRNKMVETAANKNIAARFAIKRLKGKGPVGVIIILLFLFGGLMLGSESMLPFSLVEQFKEKYDTLETSANVRSNQFLKMQMKRYGLKSITTKKIFGGTVFKMSKNQAAKLAKEGISMQEVEGADGNKRNVLLYDDGSGQQKVVVADQDDIRAIKGAIKDGKLNVNGVAISVDADDIETHAQRFEGDQTYRNKTKKQTRTWAGSVGHWFDQKTADFLETFGLTRKIFAKYISRVRGEDEGIIEARERVKDTVANAGIQQTGDASYEDSNTFPQGEDDYQYQDGVDPETDKPIMKTGTKQVDVDVNVTEESNSNEFDRIKNNNKGGTDVRKNTVKVAGITISKKSADRAKLAKERMSNITSILGSRGYKAASAMTTVGCAIFDTFGAAILLSAAQETIQGLKIAMMNFEGTQKAQVDEDSPVHVVGNALVAKNKTVFYDADDNMNVSTRMTDYEETAMQSAGIRSLYTGDKIDPSDPSVATFNLKDTFESVMGKISLSITTFTACSYARIAMNLFSLGVTVVGVVAAVATCIGSGGFGCLVAVALEGGKEIAVRAGKAAVVQKIKQYAIPAIIGTIATWYLRDLLEDLGGANYGNALRKFGARYPQLNHLEGGGAVADLSSYVAFRTEQERVIAENARYERETRSPFDPTSQHTFLGSIMKQVITLSTLSNGPANIISGMSTMVGGSVLALMPKASAANDISNDLMDPEDFKKACPYLESIGAVGDAYCNPYIVSDMSTMGTHPDDVEQALIDANMLEKEVVNGEERYEIVDGSDLAKYVVFCGNRTSEFGVMDANIANAVTSSSFQNQGGAGATIKNISMGVTPVVGDIVGILDDAKKLQNMGWISGESCVVNNNIGEAVSWANGGKIYQRYAEDQRLLSTIDPSYQSSVDTYISRYYEENPLDNSYEGILARYSGLSKDTVIATLDYMEYAKELAQYEPSERYVFRFDFDTIEKDLNLEAEADNAVSTLPLHEITYADVRNRAFAMA